MLQENHQLYSHKWVYIRFWPTLYIWCIYGNFGWETTKYTVIYRYIYGSGQPYIYGVYMAILAGKPPSIWSYTGIYTVLANATLAILHTSSLFMPKYTVIYGYIYSSGQRYSFNLAHKQSFYAGAATNFKHLGLVLNYMHACVCMCARVCVG